MQRAIEALAADRAVLLRIGHDLDPEGWNAASGCPGWSVKDLVAHMGALFWGAVDPTALPDASGLGTEEAQEVYVRSRRGLTARPVS